MSYPTHGMIPLPPPVLAGRVPLYRTPKINFQASKRVKKNNYSVKPPQYPTEKSTGSENHDSKIQSHSEKFSFSLSSADSDSVTDGKGNENSHKNQNNGRQPERLKTVELNKSMGKYKPHIEKSNIGTQTYTSIPEVEKITYDIYVSEERDQVSRDLRISIQKEKKAIKRLKKQIFEMESERRRNDTIGLIENDAIRRTSNEAENKEEELIKYAKSLREELDNTKREKKKQQMLLRERDEEDLDRYRWSYYHPIYRESRVSKEQKDNEIMEYKSMKDSLKEACKLAIDEHEEWLKNHGIVVDKDITLNNIQKLNEGHTQSSVNNTFTIVSGTPAGSQNASMEEYVV